MNNPVDQPKVSELDARALESALTRFVVTLGSKGRSYSPSEAVAEAITAYLAALPQPQATTVGVKALTAAWLGYWPSAGSIDSIARVTRSEHEAKRWAADGAEVTELVERSSPLIGIPGAEKLVPFAWRYRDSFSKPNEWDVTFDAVEAKAISEAGEGYDCDPLYLAPPAPTSERTETIYVRAGEHGLPGQNVEVPAPTSERVQEIIDMLIEARNQIEYLHGKFKETASGNAVMARLDDLRHKLQAAP